MKIQYILLIVCVVATFALPERSGDEENQNERRRLYTGGRGDHNQVTVNANDESINNSKETTTESRLSWVRHEKRRHWLKHGDGEEFHRRNSTRVNVEEQLHRFSQTHDLEEKRDSPMLDGSSQIERKHYRHRRHQHHKNRTTTVRPTGTSLSEMELAKKRDSSMPFEYSDFEKRHHSRHHHHRNRTTTTPPSSASLSETELKEKLVNLMSVGNSQIERKHHRHHHRNRTTTTTPSGTALSEMELEKKHDSPLPSEYSKFERKHHNRHHLHHRNRTITTTPSSMSLSETELEEKQDSPMAERNEHRHHHRNRTTTTTTTTTTSSPPLSDVEEVFIKRH